MTIIQLVWQLYNQYEGFDSSTGAMRVYMWTSFRPGDPQPSECLPRCPGGSDHHPSLPFSIFLIYIYDVTKMQDAFNNRNTSTFTLLQLRERQLYFSIILFLLPRMDWATLHPDLQVADHHHWSMMRRAGEDGKWKVTLKVKVMFWQYCTWLWTLMTTFIDDDDDTTCGGQYIDDSLPIASKLQARHLGARLRSEMQGGTVFP